ncbi:flagellar basal-body MS-ring/collar protein FliF [Kluyvera cryocrescens]|uniref:Flagellar M-ring protein n=1 Tax=Kluyvera cryocrescens TaxID=580 RepID=A0AAW9C2J4_KLUCR|nr:flagellar basal-body MS-ring/collar protein FliF [Kluyvera cryocrescens]MDW3775755.1 flagellar basal-body MS-ring/collar protein FliF [Kluyvera cryocrescens]MEB7714582.1 flagellar M-ring protein FliF [Kluyvera cryocrescens]WNN71859.1 flagellar basal-body MS-ring/collar protein FliF [Kluyvera cryocrescens]HDG1670729.1 flagellar M-ring protein FliF [Kluyvera cryocrescens]HDG1684968.1 flagellar M-ring protein FliF [Kluyvera cryocrescens]
MLNKIKDRLPALPMPAGVINPKLLAIAGGAVLALAIIASLWKSNQGYVALYGAQESIPVSQVVEVLGAENIAYRINPDNGQVLVTENKLSQARMALAAKGITAATPDGYELMDKEEMLGSSQFIQNVRYKRSLEGELAKSIMALNPVESARVHLGLSESSSFVLTNKPNSSASVVLQLRYGKQLDEQQVASIVQLVSGSVPGMNASSVRVVDQAGNLLSDGVAGPDGSIAGKRLGEDVMQRIREDTNKNISTLLTSLVGAGNYRISVAPTVDLSRVEETQERLGKDPLVSDEQLSQENTTNEMAFGIPGSLSNRPVNQNPQAAAAQAAGTPAANPPAAAADNATSDPRALTSRSQSQRKYAFDRDIRHIRHPGYKLEKLNVAVALNQTAPALANITPEQLTSITRLVESAAGIDKQRGDALTLDVLAFSVPVSDGILPQQWWKDPDMQYWGQNGGIGLLALLTLLFGVRPLAQRFGRRERIVKEAEPQEQDLLTDATTEKEDTLSALPNIGFNTNDDMLPPQSSGLETKVEYLQVLAQNETERVAEVLKQWINSNDRSNRKQD